MIIVMFSNFGNLFEERTQAQHRPRIRVNLPPPPPQKNGSSMRKSTFSKIFRWRNPRKHEATPATVEIAGSFTNWEKVALSRETEKDVWSGSFDIPVNKTHHYMLLVDGQPARDEHADGMAIPHSAQEKQFQLITPRGARVFLLYAQAK